MLFSINLYGITCITYSIVLFIKLEISLEDSADELSSNFRGTSFNLFLCTSANTSPCLDTFSDIAVSGL